MKTNNRNILFILLFGIVTFFINNNAIFPDIMESRNIITAREMVYQGNWMVPTMNGELRLEKPPLPTWIAAVAEYISPDNIILQRSMAGLAALLLIFYFYKLANFLTSDSKFSLISSLVLMTSYNIVLMGRTASWDIYCHAFMLGGIYYLFRSLRRNGSQMFGLALAGFFMGLSFLSKGPVSFYALLLPFLLALPFFKGFKFKWKSKSKSFIVFFIVMLMVSLWWYLLLFVYHYDKFSYVINKESGAWLNHNVRPWWYYSTFFLETGVWALILITSILFPIFRRKYKASKENILVLLWLIFQLVLLSLMPEKKNRYLLPILIPSAYLIGFLFSYWNKVLTTLGRNKFDSIIYKINSYFIAFVIALLPIAFYLFLYSKNYMSLVMFCLSSLIVWGICFYLFFYTKKKRVFSLIYGVVCLFVFFETVLMTYIGDLANNPDFNSISKTRNIEELKDLKFYNLPDEPLRIEIVYAAHKQIHPIDISDSTLVLESTPFVLLTHDKIDKVFSNKELAKYKIEYIGSFDDNHRPRSDKHHSPTFEYNLNIIRKK